MIKNYLPLSALLLTFASSAFANEELLSEQFSICMDQPDSSTVSMIDCMNAENHYRILA